MKASQATLGRTMKKTTMLNQPGLGEGVISDSGERCLHAC